MADQGLKQMARTRTAKLGHFIVEFATPGIGHILKSAGCEFVLFDLEHSGFGFETVKSAIRYFEAAGLPAIVRVPSKEYHHIARAMDMGAEGMMLPMVGNADEARAHPRLHEVSSRRAGAASRCRSRTTATGRGRSPTSSPRPTSARPSSARSRPPRGWRTPTRIAAIDGVDCLWVGHFDLSVSLGIPGEFGHPKFTDAIDKVRRRRRRKHNKALGRLVPTVEQGVELFAQGFDFICYSGDVWVLQNALAEAIGRLRAGCR